MDKGAQKIRCTCHCHSPGSNVKHAIPCCKNGFIEIPELISKPQELGKEAAYFLSVLKTVDKKLYPEIWNSLNSWTIPEYLLKNVPDWYDPANIRKLSIVAPLMQYIEKTVGKKACLRPLNNQMGDAEFNQWYNDHYDSNGKIKYLVAPGYKID